MPKEKKPFMTIKVPTSFEIEEERIQDLLTEALEGGSNHWYLIKEYRYPEGKTKADFEFQHVEVPFAEGGAIVFEDSHDGKKKDYVLDRAAMEKGLTLMASKFGAHWNTFLQENDDAETGDVFLQLALFGEVIYG